MRETDLIVVGAGPAGLAAAAEAARQGVRVLLLDEQARAGGQIYRDVGRADPGRGHILGKDYTKGLDLVREAAFEGVTHLAGAVLWQVGEDGTVAYSLGETAAVARGARVILATGAIERPMPVPGWTLPGVMTAGAGQILLKQAGMVPRRAVLVGSGPLLYLVAAQMVRAAAPPLALVETQTRADLLRALPELAGVFRGLGLVAKGLALLAELRRADVSRYTGATGIWIEGGDAAEAVHFYAGGTTYRIACDTVLLHHGVVPNVQVARSLGIPHLWDARQHCFVPETDSWGRTIHERILIAGDGAGIGGARAAALAGRLAALRIAHDIGRIPARVRDDRAAPLRAALWAERAVRPFLEVAYPPCAEALAPADDTIVCRCEEVTAGDIRRYADLGCRGPNQAKAFGRPGMGPCQGRYCGLGVSALIAARTGQTMDEVGYFRIRPPLKPITLGELAAMGVPSASSGSRGGDD